VVAFGPETARLKKLRGGEMTLTSGRINLGIVSDSDPNPLWPEHRGQTAKVNLGTPQ
jgi:hypothetical protein